MKNKLLILLFAFIACSYIASASSITSSLVTGGGGTWGSITGTLTDQTDLNTALGLKVAKSEVNTIATWTVQNSAGLSTGVQPIVLQVPSGRTITAWAVQCDVGTVTVDILKQAYATGTIPSVSVVGTGTKPAIASGTANQGTVGDWSGSLAVTANDQMSLQITAVGGGITTLVVQVYGTH